ncbi:hypothetical protein C8R46DRAFT_1124184 [Mycena filopes]|nr:hypothetical protein C8R46DRAFT_1124184 [Mycena filopes]
MGWHRGNMPSSLFIFCTFILGKSTKISTAVDFACSQALCQIDLGAKRHQKGWYGLFIFGFVIFFPPFFPRGNLCILHISNEG